jgi:carbamoyltransferase
MQILGIQASYHDSAGRHGPRRRDRRRGPGRAVHASETRLPFPANAVYCLGEAGGAGRSRCHRFYDRPFLKFERLIEPCLTFAPRGLRPFQTAMPLCIREKLFQ